MSPGSEQWWPRKPAGLGDAQAVLSGLHQPRLLDSKSDQVWADAFIWSGGWVPGQKLPWVSHICLDLINMMQALNFNKPVVLVYSVDGNLSLCKFVWVFFFLF